MFAATASAAHASTARPARAPALVPVDGGANYYARFSHGLPASRSYFPIGVWVRARPVAGRHRPGQGGGLQHLPRLGRPTARLRPVRSEPDWYALTGIELGMLHLRWRWRLRSSVPRVGYTATAAGRRTRRSARPGFTVATAARAPATGDRRPEALRTSSRTSDGQHLGSHPLLSSSRSALRRRRWSPTLTGAADGTRTSSGVGRSLRERSELRLPDRPDAPARRAGRQAPAHLGLRRSRVGRSPRPRLRAHGQSHLLRCGRRFGSRSSPALVGSSTSTTPSADRARRSTSLRDTGCYAASRPN